MSVNKFSVVKSQFFLFVIIVCVAYGFGTIYSGLTAMLEKMNFSMMYANSVYAAFVTWLFTASIAGAFLGTHLGHKHVSLMGCVFVLAGLLGFSVDIDVFWSISFYIIGMGLFLPNVLVMVGQFFKKGDNQRLSAYIVNYIGMNLGVFLGSLVSGGVQDYGFAAIFGPAVVLMAIAGIVLGTAYQYFPFSADSHCEVQNARPIKKVAFGLTLVVAAVMLYPLHMLLSNTEASDNVILWLTVFTILLILFWGYSSHELTMSAKNKLLLFFAILLPTVFFWALYDLEESVLVTYYNGGVNHHFLGMNMPVQVLGCLNASFNVVIGGLMILFGSLNKQHLPPYARAFLGIIVMGVAYLALSYFAGRMVPVSQAMPFIWVMLVYFLMSLAEMIIAPLNLSLATEYGPGKLQGIMIGSTQLVMGASGALADHYSDSATFQKGLPVEAFNHIMSKLSFHVGALTVSVGLGLLLVGFLFSLYVQHILLSKGKPVNT